VRLSLLRRFSPIAPRQGQFEREPGAASFLGIDPHPAAHFTHQALRDEETEAGPLGAGCFVELREDALALRLRDPDPLVSDGQLDVALNTLAAEARPR